MATRKYQCLAAALAVVVGLILFGAGCADKITGKGSATLVTIDFDLKAGPAVTFLLTITAADMDTIRTLMGPTDNGVATVVEVPPGTDRHFLAEALDINGVVMYRGETVSDVIALQPLDLTIDMPPAVPMVYLNPHYSTVNAGDEFTITICANELVGLSGISMGLSFGEIGKGDKLFDPAVIDTIVIHPDQSAFDGTLFVSSQGPTSVFFNLATEVGPIVDASGDACLVTIHCRTQDTWPSGPIDVIPAIFIETLNGIGVGRDSVYVDTARFRIVRQRVPESYLGGPDDEIGAALVPLAGGGAMLAGNLLSIDPNNESRISSLYVARLDAALQPQPETLIPWNFLQTTTGMAAAAGGGFYAIAADFQNGGEVVFIDDGAGEIWRANLAQALRNRLP